VTSQEGNERKKDETIHDGFIRGGWFGML